MSTTVLLLGSIVSFLVLCALVLRLCDALERLADEASKANYLRLGMLENLRRLNEIELPAICAALSEEIEANAGECVDDFQVIVKDCGIELIPHEKDNPHVSPED